MVMPIGDKEYIVELEEERNVWRRNTIALREENARLREALQDIETADGGVCESGYSAGYVARAALAQTQPEEESAEIVEWRTAQRGFAPTDALGDARVERAEEPGTGYTDSDGHPAGLGLEQP